MTDSSARRPHIPHTRYNPHDIQEGVGSLWRNTVAHRAQSATAKDS